MARSTVSKLGLSLEAFLRVKGDYFGSADAKMLGADGVRSNSVYFKENAPGRWSLLKSP